MSSEGTGQLLQGESIVEVKHEPKKSPKLLYTSEFLLSLSELDVCKKLPLGFDSSVLSELGDTSSSTFEWQRGVGGLSLLGSKRNDYGPASSNRVEGTGTYFRGGPGRWDTHSTGSSDRDGDTQTDREPISQDSGRRNVNPFRWSSQKPEHDGLLGSGAFPRPSGYQGWASGLKSRGDGNYQLNKSNEPYQPPRPYKALPFSRKDNTDSYNEETFGSSECSSQDRAEEERKRRESFELMRKEQQKAFQEKQKQISDKHKDNIDNDIIALLKNSEVDKHKNNEKLEENAATLASQGDFGRYPVNSLASASRPLVPPGFASATAEKSLVILYSNSRGSVVGNVETGQSSLLVNGEEGNPKNGKASGSHAHSDKDENKITKDGVTDTRRQDNPASILDKLFGNALTKKDDAMKSEEGAEKDEQTWSPTSSRSSKFASWFREDDERLSGDISSRDLLSLIASKKESGSGISAVSHEHVHPNLPFEDSESGQKSVIFGPTPSIGGFPESYCNKDKPVTGSCMLTCEDLEQSILAEAKENRGSLPDYTQGACITMDANFELQKSDIDDHASQHLLSLLHTGTHSIDFTSLSNPELMLSSGNPSVDTEPDAIVGFSSNACPDNAETVHSEPGKSLTLEALFGSAFMKELHSTEAPISQQGVPDDACIDTSVSLPSSMPCPFFDSRLSSGEDGSIIIHKENMNHTHGAGLQKLELSRMGFEYSQIRSSKPAGIVQHGGRSLEVHLPEEESLIDSVDPIMHDPFRIENAPNAEQLLRQRTDGNIVDKLTYLNVTQHNERSSSSVLDDLTHAPYDIVEPALSYQHVHGQPYLQQPDNTSCRNPQMKFGSPGNIHNGPRRPFPGILHQHVLHGSGGPRLDPTFHLSRPHAIPISGNFTPHHLQFFPRGVPLSHPLNRMPDYMSEAENNFQRQPGYGGYEMGMPGTGVNGPGGNHLQTLGSLEMSASSQQTHISAAGHAAGIYGSDLDFCFRYR